MDSALSVVQAVIVTLKADGAVASLVGDRIFTDVPQKSGFPYVVLSVDSQPFAASDFSGQEHTLRIQCFSQEKTVKQVLNVRKACTDALDRKEASISLSAGELVKCEYSGAGTMFKEDDGKAWQAINEMSLVVV